MKIEAFNCARSVCIIAVCLSVQPEILFFFIFKLTWNYHNGKMFQSTHTTELGSKPERRAKKKFFLPAEVFVLIVK